MPNWGARFSGYQANGDLAPAGAGYGGEDIPPVLNGLWNVPRLFNPLGGDQQNQDGGSLDGQDTGTPPAVVNLLDTAKQGTDTILGPPSITNFFDPGAVTQDQGGNLPPAIQNLIDTLVGNGGGNVADTTLNQSGLVTPTQLAGPEVSVVTTDNSVKATILENNSVNTTNTFVNPILNFLFGSGDTGGNSSVVTPAVTGGNDTGPVPVYNDATLGQIVTPTTAAQGQVVDRGRSAPSGLPANIAGTIRGLNLPGVSRIKSNWGVIATFVLVPLGLLAALWLVGKALRK